MQDWVFEEVIPSIRKYGYYVEPKTAEQLLNNPELMIKALQDLIQERKAKEESLAQKENKLNLTEIQGL